MLKRRRLSPDRNALNRDTLAQFESFRPDWGHSGAQEAYKIAKAAGGGSTVPRVNPEVAKLLKSAENRHLEELEQVLGCPVLVTGDPLLLQEKFDLS